MKFPSITKVPLAFAMTSVSPSAFGGVSAAFVPVCGGNAPNALFELSAFAAFFVSFSSNA